MMNGFQVTETKKVDQFFQAIRKHNFKAVQTLLKAGLSPNVHEPTCLFIPKNSEHKITALHKAAELGFEDIVKILLEFGADKAAKTTDGATPLHFAARSGNVKCIELLCVDNPHVNAQETKNSFTALHWAVCQKHFEAVEALLKIQGIDVTIEDHQGHTPLMIADDRGGDYIEIAKALYDHRPPSKPFNSV